MQSTAENLLLKLTSANAGLSTMPERMSNPEAEQPSGNPDVPQPAPGKLAEAFEDKKCLRRRAKDDEYPHMTRWLNLKATNVPSVKAMSLNHTALECLAEWWCPTIPYPKAVPIDLLRREVGVRCCMVIMVYLWVSLGHLS